LPEALSHARIQAFDNLTLLKMWCETTAFTIFPKRKIGYLKDGYEANFLVLTGNPLLDFVPGDDKSYLRSVFKAARELGVGVGGPDLLPFKRSQLNHSYPLIAQAAGLVPTGVAVQEGNYAEKNPATGRRLTIAELLQFATTRLKVDYVFWCTEDPYYTGEVIPFMQSH
jgi:hypothetical protein